MIRLSRERLSIAAGLALLAVGSVTVVSGVSAEQASEISPQMKAREDTLATGIGRPLQLDIDNARKTLVPERNSTSGVYDYYGDEKNCAQDRRNRYETIDAACRVLTKAHQALGRWAEVQQQDSTLQSLRETHSSRLENVSLRIIGGAAEMALGAVFTTIGALSAARERRRRETIQATA